MLQFNLFFNSALFFAVVLTEYPSLLKVLVTELYKKLNKTRKLHILLIEL